MGRRHARTGYAPIGSDIRTAMALIGATGFTTGDRYATTAPGGEAGVVGGFWAAALFKLSVQSGNRVITGTISGTAGWSIDTAAGPPTAIVMTATNGVPGFVEAPRYTILPADLGKIMMAVGVHDGSNVRLYVNRLEVGTGTAITGYTAGSGAQGIGARGAGGAFTGGTIFGVTAGRGTKTLAQIQAMFDDVKIARDILASGMNPTNGWSFKRAGGAVPPASVANLGSGTDAQTRVGTALTYEVVSNPVWGW